MNYQFAPKVYPVFPPPPELLSKIQINPGIIQDSHANTITFMTKSPLQEEIQLDTPSL